jgi:hypothetical protein
MTEKATRRRGPLASYRGRESRKCSAFAGRPGRSALKNRPDLDSCTSRRGDFPSRTQEWSRRVRQANSPTHPEALVWRQAVWGRKRRWEVKRLMILILAACTALLVVGLSNAAAAPTTVTCTDAFSGTAFNVVVPDDNFCVLSGATITHDLLIGVDAGAGAGVEAGESGLTVGHDVTMQHDSEVDFGATVIGHDLIGTTNDAFHLERDSILGDLLAFQPATVQTGGIGPETPGGPVHVLGDLLIQGTPPDNDFVFDGLGGGLLTVGRDLRITDNRHERLGAFGLLRPLLDCGQREQRRSRPDLHRQHGGAGRRLDCLAQRGWP